MEILGVKHKGLLDLQAKHNRETKELFLTINILFCFSSYYRQDAVMINSISILTVFDIARFQWKIENINGILDNSGASNSIPGKHLREAQ